MKLSNRQRRVLFHAAAHPDGRLDISSRYAFSAAQALERRGLGRAWRGEHSRSFTINDEGKRVSRDLEKP